MNSALQNRYSQGITTISKRRTDQVLRQDELLMMLCRIWGCRLLTMAECNANGRSHTNRNSCLTNPENFGPCGILYIRVPQAPNYELKSAKQVLLGGRHAGTRRTAEDYQSESTLWEDVKFVVFTWCSTKSEYDTFYIYSKKLWKNSDSFLAISKIYGPVDIH